MNELTARDWVWYTTGIQVPEPEPRYSKKMPCGHYGVLVLDKWVCQTCFGWKQASSAVNAG